MYEPYLGRKPICTFIRHKVYKFYTVCAGTQVELPNWTLVRLVMLIDVSEHLSLKFLAEYRQNFMKLKKLVMISGPNDTVITPWQSAHLGFYDENEVVQPFEKQQVS